MSDATTASSSPPVLSAESSVYVVEDDVDLRDALDCLLGSVGLLRRMFETPAEFLAALPLSRSGCVVLDIRLPRMSGIDLAKEIRRRDVRLPILVMSAHADVPVTIQAFKLGVLDFLIKPFESQQFLDAVRQALLSDGARLADELRIEQVASRLKQLTKKDWEIIDLLRPGHPNKRIAAMVGISERAVEMRRAALLKKTETSSLAELFELVALCPRDHSC